jgi:hypothetical protein
MVSVLFTVGALAVVGIVGPLFALISEKQPTYGSQLEEYIVSQNPRDIADVERLTVEYDRKTKEGYL